MLIREAIRGWRKIRAVVWLFGAQAYAKERANVKQLVRELSIVTEVGVAAADADAADADDADDADAAAGGGGGGGDAAVPLTKQGNLELYSTEQLKKRKALALNPSITGLIDRLWRVRDLVERRSVSGGLSHDVYVELLIKFHYLIVPPPVDLELARKNAETDWENDSRNRDELDEAMFQCAIFQIADTWSHTVPQCFTDEELSQIGRKMSGTQTSAEVFDEFLAFFANSPSEQAQ